MLGRCDVHQIIYDGDLCPACELVNDRQRLIDRALKAEGVCEDAYRLLTKVAPFGYSLDQPVLVELRKIIERKSN